MGRQRKFSDEDMVAALRETKGMVYLAAQRLGCNPNSLYKRAEKSRAVREAIDGERGKVVDTAELKLYKAIIAEEPWAIQLCLKTLGRNRGYVERLQVEDVTRDEVIAQIEAELARLAGRRPAANAVRPPGTNGQA